jgi:diaminopimelate decarboxylase
VRVEGVDVTTVAESVGTPFYCYSAAKVSRAYRDWRAAFAEVGFDGPRHRTCFAVKANGALALLRHLSAAGSGFDVVSTGELRRVRAAGGSLSEVVFSGPGKRAEDLREAVACGVGLINVEAPGEVPLLRQYAEAAERRVAIGLRLNPDLDAKTHPSITTGPRQTKFGLAPDEIDDLLASDAFGRHLEVRAVAVHIGSQVTDLEPLVAAADQALQWADRLATCGQPVDWIDIGGGLGIPYEDGMLVPTPRQYAARIGGVLSDWRGGLITEPGRIIAGPAGWLVTRVTSVRRRGDRGLLVCDAGMNALLRPALYGAAHDVIALSGQGGPATRWDVVGPLCETGDVLARDVDLVDVDVGSLLAVCDAGAYGYVMSSEYNAHPRPSQVWVEGDRWAVITARRSLDEMLDGEQMPPWDAPSADGDD